MKGLIYKDACILRTYFRAYSLTALIFSAMAVFCDSAFFLAYIFIVTTTVPLSVMTEDNNSGWNVYAATMPYSRAQLVAVKYIDGLIMLGFMLVFAVISLVGIMLRAGSFSAGDFFNVLGLGVSAALFNLSALLPCAYKFGAEKGRVIFLFIIGIEFATLALLAYSGFVSSDTSVSSIPAVVLLLAAVALYVLSWSISTAIYAKQEF